VTGSPDLFVLAGPNGAGKTTFFERILAPTGLDLINADRIAALRWPGDEQRHAYAAADEAARLRERYLADRRSFVTETVFSHPSKVELVRRAAQAGYRVHLRVLMVPVDLAVARVDQRVREGGHAVPVTKIRERHARLWAHVSDAIGLAF
jgi:predicted ABC-type ATPase